MATPAIEQSKRLKGHALEPTLLQGRNLSVSLGPKKEAGLHIEGLHINVNIKRSLEGGTLDSAKVTLINTNKPCLDLVMKSQEPVYVQINAWYSSTEAQGSGKNTFLGEIVPPISFSHDNFVDTNLKFTALDGYDVLTKKKYSGNFPTDTSYYSILEDIVTKSSAPVEKPLENEAIKQAATKKITSFFSKFKLPKIFKTALPTLPKLNPSSMSQAVKEKLLNKKTKSAWGESGKFTDVLDSFCKIHDLKWSVQNGIVRIILKKDRFQYNFYKLDQSTLVEPMVEEKSASTTLVLYKCKAMFLADVLPGDYIAVFDSRFLVVEVEHILSNYGTDFHTNLTMEELEGGYEIKPIEVPKILTQAESKKLKEDQKEQDRKSRELANIAKQKNKAVKKIEGQ